MPQLQLKRRASNGMATFKPFKPLSFVKKLEPELEKSSEPPAKKQRLSNDHQDDVKASTLTAKAAPLQSSSQSFQPPAIRKPLETVSNNSQASTLPEARFNVLW